MKINKQEIKEKYGIYEYENGDYSYEDDNGKEHLIRNGIEIASGDCVDSYNNGDYLYKDNEGIYHIFNKDNERIN